MRGGVGSYAALCRAQGLAAFEAGWFVVSEGFYASGDLFEKGQYRRGHARLKKAKRDLADCLHGKAVQS